MGRTPEDLVEALRRLPHPDTRGYAVEVQGLVARHSDDFIDVATQLLTDYDEALAADPEHHRPGPAAQPLTPEATLGFAAWYGLLFVRRRRKDFSEVDRLEGAYFENFRDVALAKLMRVERITRAPETLGGLSTGVVLHAEAHAVVGEFLSLSHYLLGALLAARADRTLDQTLRHSLYTDALAAHYRSWELRPDYGRPLERRAQILQRMGRYEEALAEIDRAIERESSTTSDYALRIGDYQSTLIGIKLDQSASRIAAAQAQQEAAVADLRNQFVDLIALIGLVIAFLTVAVSFARYEDPLKAILLFVAAGGVLIVVFAAFRAMLIIGGSAVRDRRVGVIVGVSVGAALLVVAITGVLLLGPAVPTP